MPSVDGYNFYTIDEVKQMYDNGNLTGVIEMETMYEFSYTQNFINGQYVAIPIDGTTNSAYAGLLDNNSDPLSVTDIKVNNVI